MKICDATIEVAIMKILNLALICLMLAGATAGHAGEALVSRVRGKWASINKVYNLSGML
jgi:hypothetical protein